MHKPNLFTYLILSDDSFQPRAEEFFQALQEKASGIMCIVISEIF